MKNTVLWRALKPAVFAGLVSSLASLSSTLSAQTVVTNAPKWESSAALGLSLTRGNSDTELFTVNVRSQRKTPENEILLGGDGAYGTSSGVKNNETLDGFGQYNRLVSHNFYWGARLDALHDGIADVKYRVTLAPLAGYYFIKDKATTLSAEFGPAVVFQKQDGTSSTFASLRFAERFEHKFSDRARIWQSIEILPKVTDFSNYFINAEVGVESALTKKTSLRAYVQDTYYSVPAPGRLKNDVKLVTAIAYKF
jgi:putative salt-induced outer membrane protein YdiY